MKNFAFALAILISFFACKKPAIEALESYKIDTVITPVDTTTFITNIQLSSYQDTFYCIKNNEILVIDATPDTLSQVVTINNYLWNTSSNSTTITVNDTGYFSVEISLDSLTIDTVFYPIGIDTTTGDTIYADSVIINNFQLKRKNAIYITNCKVVENPDTTIIFPGNEGIYVPSSFSPDGDNDNDMWLVKGNEIQSILIQIRNTDGVLMLETTDILKGWDGKHNGTPMPDGYYLYYIEYTTTSSSQKKVKQDRLELFRL